MQKLALNGAVWIDNLESGERFLGKGRIQLMQLIIEHGSIAKAAKAMGMSYKRAWDLITSMNNQVENPFVITQTGGIKGGGAIVTPEGKQAITEFESLKQRFQEFLQNESKNMIFMG